MIDEAIMAKAVELLQKAAPAAKVVLFGSYARGTANDKSDLDLLSSLSPSSGHAG